MADTPLSPPGGEAAPKVLAVANLREYFRNSVEAAVRNQKLDVDDHTTCYVVNILTAFSRSEALYDRTDDGMFIRPLVFQLADAVDSESPQRREAALQRLGDVALFMAGFFAASFARRMVDVDYYVAMGESAYGSLSDSLRGPRARAFCGVFSELADKFQSFVDVLNEVSEASGDEPDVLRLYELWMKTGSRRAEGKLRELGVVPLAAARGFGAQ